VPINSFLVSIIIPTYNRKKLLKETLNSILQLTYANIECIIVDDGSNDGTLEMLEKFCTTHPSFRFLERPENKLDGASTCRNIGLEHAKGAYIIFFDSDDILPPTALQKRMNYIQNNPDFDFWVFQTVRFKNTLADADRIWNDLSKPNHADLHDFLGINPVWHTSGPVWRKNFLAQHSLSFTEGVQSWQDWEFHIRVLLQAPNYLKIEDVSAAAYQRFHDSESINKQANKSITENRLSLFFTLIKAFKTAGKFDKSIQQSFLKLFYFVFSRQKENIALRAVWLEMEKHFTDIAKIDLLYWKYYLLFSLANASIESRVFLFLVKLKPYFEKRIRVTDFSHRTWYRINLK
jgi:glycosyltransferase involved in cell wall biosynthesis